MNESSVPLSRALAAAGWTISTLLLIAAWIVFGAGYDHLAVLLGLTGVPFTAGAGLATVWGWTSRICRIVQLSAARESVSVTPFR